MYKFQTIYTTTTSEYGKLEPLKLILLINSKILKVEFDRIDYKGNYNLSVLVQIDLDQNKDSDYILEIFTDQDKISNSYIYINSFKNEYNDEYHVCLLKEQN